MSSRQNLPRISGTMMLSRDLNHSNSLISDARNVLNLIPKIYFEIFNFWNEANIWTCYYNIISSIRHGDNSSLNSKHHFMLDCFNQGQKRFWIQCIDLRLNIGGDTLVYDFGFCFWYTNFSILVLIKVSHLNFEISLLKRTASLVQSDLSFYGA